MIQKASSIPHTLHYKSALIFSLTAILPLLLFLFVLEQHKLLIETEVQIVLGMSMVIAITGFIFFRQIVKQINSLADDFFRLERGELQELGERVAPLELTEMARIADSFNNVLTDLKANTRELENLVYKLSTLSELTELVSRIPDIREVLQIVLHRTMAVVNAKICSIMLLDEVTQTLNIAAAEGLEESVVARTSIRPGEGISGKVLQTGESVLVEDVERDSRFSKANDPKYETSSFICMPLRTKERVIGVLNLSKRGDKKAFSESDLRFLKTLLSYVSFAVENARLLKEAREAAVKLRQVVHNKSMQLDQAQQQLLQSTKLSALGELIAGVAHDLNNPLTTVMGYSQLLSGKVQDGKMHRDLKKIFEEAQRAAKIVQNLLSFARQEPPEKRSWQINDILKKILKMQANELRVNNIEVHTELIETLPPILVDANQLQQVFLNIINNARQAMMEQETPRRLCIKTAREGERLIVEFTDSGPGIEPEFLDRIFDPFFTTKPKGKGTGLGLSISYGIVKSHGGEISVTSRQKEGTTFSVELPVATEAPAPLPVEHRNNGTLKQPLPSILVIEDEENINELIAEILTQEGYRVDVVQTGELGVQKLLEEKYDLILCDLRMPGMDGHQVYDEVKKAKPYLAQRFLFMTGGIMNEESKAFLKETGDIFLMKPFTTEIFLDAIERSWQRITQKEKA